MPATPLTPPVARPLKRPVQARARFTVQTIYDGLVRIWLRDGPDAVTMKAVAAETGFAVGTLYDYFPNRAALLSGYVRHCIDDLIRRLEADAAAEPDLPWGPRIVRLVRMTCGQDGAAPCFDHDMLMVEHAIAEEKHHRRAYEELSAAWLRILEATPGRPPGIDAAAIRAAFLIVLGTRRYVLLVEPTEMEVGDWAGRLERMCLGALAGG
ncbi:TetR/AcrR family transcriptional regulator [Tistrella mobilis]